MSKRKSDVPDIRNDAGLLVYNVDGQTTCLGYLMDFKEKGVYEPTLGKVDVTPEDAKKHNEVLSAAEIKGLDENCQVGQCGVFFVSYHNGKPVEVKTWIGTVVSTEVRQQLRRGKWYITFVRNGRMFVGTKERDADCVTFERVA